MAMVDRLSDMGSQYLALAWAFQVGFLPSITLLYTLDLVSTYACLTCTFQFKSSTLPELLQHLHCSSLWSSPVSSSFLSLIASLFRFAPETKL